MTVISASSILNRALSYGTQRAKLKREHLEPTSAKSLTDLILAHLNANRLKKAVSILFSSPYPIPYPLYACLFRLCACRRAIIEARKVESHLASFSSPSPPLFLFNRAIETYGICGCLEDAKELFDEMPHRDGGSWNAIIKAFNQCRRPEYVSGLFRYMCREGVSPNEITFASVLGSCGDVLDLDFSRQVHGLVEKFGFRGNVILESSLVDVYGKCEAMEDARRIFDEIVDPNDVTWNVIVRRYLEAGEEEEAVLMFFKMLHTGMMPSKFTFSNALKACSQARALIEGMRIHGVVIKTYFEDDEVVSSSLIDMYAKCRNVERARRVFDQCCSRDLISWTAIVSAYTMSGRTREARELFDEMPERNVISWNAMLAGYAHSSEWKEALEFVILMRYTTKDIDHITLGYILKVCAGLTDVEMGKQVHGFIYRHGFSSDIFVGNALVDMYGKCGKLKSASVGFYQLCQSRDNISWNALLTSFAGHFQSELALAMFGKMQWETKPSNFTFGTLLAACANIFALDQGKQIHGFMFRNGYDIDIVIRGALVDMYCKCRCPAYALVVFREEASRDLFLWNTMILGCYHNAMSKEVSKLFEFMVLDGVKPDHITFKGILLACVDEGFVELAMQYFNAMRTEYYIYPRLEHYECMVQLFCRHGCMDELESFVKEMPFDPTVPMLVRVFDACREHGCVNLGEWAAEQLNALNPSIPYAFEVMERAKVGMV